MTLGDIAAYTLPVERSDWDLLLVDWQPLLPTGMSPWLFTRFGELFFEQPDEKIGMLQVSSFHYEIVAKNKRDFEEWLVDADKMMGWFLAPLVDRLVANGKTLGADTCYSFVMPPGLGGRIEEKNVSILPIREHFECWGDVFRQIKDVAPGSHVIFTRN